MPSTPCAIVVDPEGLTVTVNITRHIGDATSTPTTYTAEHGTTAHTLPLEISSETEFWLTEPGDYTVSVLYNGNEIAGGAPAPGESGQAVRREVGHGQRWRIVPSVDTEELRSGASVGALVAAKTVTEEVASSVTLQNDDHLFVALRANETYAFELAVRYDNAGTATADLLAALTVPAGATLAWEWIGMTAADVLTTSAVDGSGTTATFGATNSNARMVLIRGTVVVGATSGNLQFQWAQAASSAFATRVHAGSHLVAHQT